MKTDQNEIFKKLQEKDYRLTDIRKSVIKILFEKEHVSMNDIILQLKQENTSVNIMSIYNTIDLLLEEHIIHANVFENKQIFYELTSDNVVHIICNICHDYFHLDDEESDKAFVNINKLKKKLKENSIDFLHFNLEIHGICKECRNKIKKT